MLNQPLPAYWKLPRTIARKVEIQESRRKSWTWNVLGKTERDCVSASSVETLTYLRYCWFDLCENVSS